MLLQKLLYVDLMRIIEQNNVCVCVCGASHELCIKFSLIMMINDNGNEHHTRTKHHTFWPKWLIIDLSKTIAFGINQQPTLTANTQTKTVRKSNWTLR